MDAPQAEADTDYDGPVEVDKTHMGGKRKNMSTARRKELPDTGRDTAGKTAVVGAKDRATNRVAVRRQSHRQADATRLRD